MRKTAGTMVDFNLLTFYEQPVTTTIFQPVLARSLAAFELHNVGICIVAESTVEV